MTVIMSGATTRIVPGFYPDPTICRVGANYYLAHSRSKSLPLAGPYDIVLSFAGPDGRKELARLDRSYLSTEVATGFTGRMLALGAHTVPARVRSVTYQPLNDEGDA